MTNPVVIFLCYLIRNILLTQKTVWINNFSVERKKAISVKDYESIIKNRQTITHWSNNINLFSRGGNNGRRTKS